MLGIDLVDIGRVARAAETPRFLMRVFTERERAYAAGSAEKLAGMFAAKEAAVKALGTGFRGIGFTDVEVRHDQYGAPGLVFYRQAALMTRNSRCEVSITHDRNTAAAVVIVWKREG